MTTNKLSSPVFYATVEFIIDEIEGGHSDRANDRGGETKFGISKKQYPHLDIALLTKADAIELYHADYWQRYRCGELPIELAVFYFDCVIQHSPKAAGKFLQSAIGAFPDGVVGSKTIGVARRAAELSPEIYREKVALAFALRADYMHDIAVSDRTQEANMVGWFKRLFELQRFINQDIACLT